MDWDEGPPQMALARRASVASLSTYYSMESGFAGSITTYFSAFSRPSAHDTTLLASFQVPGHIEIDEEFEPKRGGQAIVRRAIWTRDTRTIVVALKIIRNDNPLAIEVRMV